MTMRLTGMMGSGKTSSGMEAAASLRVPFHDTDVEVTRENGSTIPELWDSIGEDGFRDLEKLADHVIDTSDKTVDEVAQEIEALWKR